MFTKSVTESPIPFGVYRFDHKYIEALRKKDKNIIDPKDNDRYCGPVYTAVSPKGVSSFFIPIDKSYDTTNVFSSIYNDGVYSEVFNLSKMIPCVDKRFIVSDNSNPNLVSFCEKSRNDLEYYADLIMKTIYPELRH